MSKSQTRSQYVFLEVKKSEPQPCVILSGPYSAIGCITSYNNVNTGDVSFDYTMAGIGAELRLMGNRKDLDYSMLMKAGLLEEVTKRGFIPLSNVADDFLVLSPEVAVDPSFFGC